MRPLDIDSVKAHFPTLTREVAGRPAIFADAPGGTQVPQTVIDAIVRYLSHSNANEGGPFVTSQETEEVIDGARRAAGDFLGCDPNEAVFGANMTSLAFSLSRALARDLNEGDEVVVTDLDHDANIAPWIAAAEDRGAVVRRVAFNPFDCTIDLASLDDALNDRTRIVAFTLASNAVGTITAVDEILNRVRRTDAIAIADAVHYAPHGPIDVRSLDLDVLFCSPYKFFGPHMGVMYARAELLERWRPYRVRPSSNEIPNRWETGTKNHEGLAGFTACVDYLASLGGDEGDRRSRLVAGAERVHAHERDLSVAFMNALDKVSGVEVFGIGDVGRVDERTPTFALRIPGRDTKDLTRLLGERGIFTWGGNYYALSLMERLELEDSGGATRIGFCHYHSVDEVERVAQALADLLPEA